MFLDLFLYIRPEPFKSYNAQLLYYNTMFRISLLTQFFRIIVLFLTTNRSIYAVSIRLIGQSYLYLLTD